MVKFKLKNVHFIQQTNKRTNKKNKNDKAIDINDLDIDCILVSTKFPRSSKYPIIKKAFRFFIGYLNHSDDDDMTPLLCYLI